MKTYYYAIAFIGVFFCSSALGAPKPMPLPTSKEAQVEMLLSQSLKIFNFDRAFAEHRIWIEIVGDIISHPSLSTNERVCMIRTLGEDGYKQVRRDMIRTYLSKKTPAQIADETAILPSVVRAVQAKDTEHGPNAIDQANFEKFMTQYKYRDLQRAVLIDMYDYAQTKDEAIFEKQNAALGLRMMGKAADCLD